MYYFYIYSETRIKKKNKTESEKTFEVENMNSIHSKFNKAENMKQEEKPYRHSKKKREPISAFHIQQDTYKFYIQKNVIA